MVGKIEAYVEARMPGDATAIEWVLAVARAQGKRAAVWNPVRGCRPVGEGCRNCWAAASIWRCRHDGP